VVRRNADIADARMRDRAPYESDVTNARVAKIADVLAAPAQESVILLARDRRAYSRSQHGRFFHDSRHRISA
jgi:hypothetical protein